MTMKPAKPPRPHSALELLFGQAEGGAGPLAILSAEVTGNLGRALESFPAVTRETAVSEVRAAAAGLLDINLTDMLLAGWRQFHDLTSAARRTLAAPGSSELVSLVTHRITTEQQPYVKLLVDGHPLATVRFGVCVDFDVSALLAGVSAGRLVAVHTGRCDITATLAIDDVEVVTRQARLELAGAIPVTPAIRLLPAHEYAVTNVEGGGELAQPTARAGAAVVGGGR